MKMNRLGVVMMSGALCLTVAPLAMAAPIAAPSMPACGDDADDDDDGETALCGDDADDDDDGETALCGDDADDDDDGETSALLAL